MVRVINIDTKNKTIHIENADKDIQWVTSKGVHIPIKPGETKEQAISEFINKKRGGLKYAGGSNPPMWSKKQQEEKKESGLLGDRYDAKHGTKPEKSKAPLLSEREVKDVTEKETKKAEGVDISDPIEEVDWSKATDKNLEDAKSKYSWAKAHYGADSSYAKGWQKVIDKINEAKPAKEIGKPGDNIQYVGDLLKTPKVKELYDRIGKYAKEHASELPLDHLEHLVALRKILLDDNNAAEHVEKNFQKWFGK